MITELKLDYVTMNFPTDTFSFSSLQSELFDDVKVFRPVNNKPDCKVFNSDFGVCFKSDNGNKVTEKTQSILFGGKGCELFLNKFAPLYDSLHPSISRCDFAFDVDFSVDDWRSFVTSVFDKSINDNRYQYAFRLITSHDMLACTVNIGSRRGKYFFRIYNKTLESHLPFDGSHYLIRFELEIKYDRKIRDGVCSEFHVEPFFESYFSDNHDLVFDSVLSGWKMALKGFELPFSLEDLTFVLPTKLFILLGSNLSIQPLVRSSLCNYFSRYESPASYIADRHGCSAIKVVLCPDLLRKAEYRYFEKTGLHIHLNVNFWVEGEDESDFFSDSYVSYQQLSL